MCTWRPSFQSNTEDEQAELHYGFKTYTPYVWQRTGTGIRIQDLREPHFDSVLKVFQKEYIPNELLLKSVQLKSDEISLKSFLDRLLFHLQNMSSLIAFDETLTTNEDAILDDTSKIAGILILRVIKILDYGRVTSRMKLTNGDALQKCVRLRACLNKKVDIFAQFDCDIIMRCYDLCIVRNYRHLDLGRHMMKCAIQLARSRGVPLVMGIFNHYRLQNLVQDLGMVVCHSINYSNWRDSEQNTEFFNLGVENDSCKLMACQVPKPLPFPKSPVIPVVVQKKGAKDKKKGAKDKKKK